MIPERYTVGRDGRVWIQTHNDFRVCFVAYNSNGYPRIQVNHRGRRKWYLIHHLVMFYHGPPKPEGKWEIGHRDGDRNNAALSNLHWTTREQNNQQAWDDGRRESLRERQRVRMTAFRAQQLAAKAS